MLRSGLGCVFEELAQLAVVEDRGAQIEQVVDDFVASDEIAGGKPRQCSVDHGDDAGLVHLGLLDTATRCQLNTIIDKNLVGICTT